MKREREKENRVIDYKMNAKATDRRKRLILFFFGRQRDWEMVLGAIIQLNKENINVNTKY